MNHNLPLSVFALLTVTCFVTPTFGQDIVPAEETAPGASRPLPAPEPDVVIQPTDELAPFSKVIYVLDVSGSMRGELAEAIRTIDVFMTDDFGAAAVTFNAEHARWKGVENHHGHDATAPCNNRCSPAGWCRMPEHRLELLAHLNSFIGDGDTQPASAVAYAIRNAPAECLIVFISDGGFVGAPVVDAAKAGIAWRKEQEMAPVQLLVWSTKKDADKQTSLVDLAKIGGGGLWRAKPPEDQETPPGDPR